jgi:hypothetical protein
MTWRDDLARQQEEAAVLRHRPPAPCASCADLQAELALKTLLVERFDAVVRARAPVVPAARAVMTALGEYFRYSPSRRDDAAGAQLDRAIAQMRAALADGS